MKSPGALVVAALLAALAGPARAAECPRSGPMIHEQFDACIDEMADGVSQKAPDVKVAGEVIKLIDAKFDKDHANLPKTAPIVFNGQPIAGENVTDMREGFVYPIADKSEKLYQIGHDPSMPNEQKAQLVHQLYHEKQELIGKAKADALQQTAFGGLMKGAFDAYKEWQQQHQPQGPAGGPPNNSPIFGPGNWGSPAVPQLQEAANKLQGGDDAAARAAAAKALENDPANVDALKLRAQAAALMGDNASANRDAKAGLALDPGNKDLQTLAAITEGRSLNGANAAALAAGLGSGGGAGSGVSAAGGAGLSGLPRVSGEQAAAGSLARDAGNNLALDPDKAIELASKAIALDGQNPNAFFARGMAYERKGDHESALKDAVAGLAVNPKSSALWALKAGVLAREGRYAEAREAAERSLEFNPRNAAAWTIEANSLAGLGDRAGALKALANAAALDPGYKAMYEAAVNAPQDSDLMFLFAGGDKASPAQKPADRKHRFGALVGVAVVGGGLIGLGLLQFLIPPLKSAFTKMTRKESAVHAGQFADAAIATPRPGGSASLLRGQYKTLRKIGAGGMGEVFEGEDVSLGRKVAIKRMREEIKADRRERARFVSEAKLVAALHHPSIVDIYAIVEEGDDVFLVFEYIAGQTLHEAIQSKGRLTLDEALPILKSVVDGLEYAHGRGIIHRDLKPSNIMVDDSGRPRVMDFGIARMAKDAMTRAAMTNTIVGTPPYMAPEQEQGLVRKESDVYALSICLYEMLTGRLAFAGTGAGMLMNKVNKAFAPVTTLAPELPQSMDQVFADALEPDPAKRIATPKDLLARVEAVVASRKL